MKYKVSYHIENNITDIFNLPCVWKVIKDKSGPVFYLTDDRVAYTGDWICMDYEGGWHIVKDDDFWR